jgi:hypothetical protein
LHDGPGFCHFEYISAVSALHYFHRGGIVFPHRSQRHAEENMNKIAYKRAGNWPFEARVGLSALFSNLICRGVRWFFKHGVGKN